MNTATILAGGARLVRTQPGAVAIWGAVYLVACIVMMWWLAPMFAELTAFHQQAFVTQASGLPPPPPPAGFFASITLFNLLLLVLLAVIFAATVRAVAAGEGRDTFAFLRFGMDELRLVGLAVILTIVGIVAMFGLGLVLGIVIAALAATGGGEGVAIVLIAVMMIALVVLTVWVQVRLSLAGALTVLRGRIVIREAWRATHDRFWPLFGVFLLIGVAYVVFSVLLVAVGNPDLLTAYAGGMQPAAMQTALAEQQAMLTDPFSVRTIVIWMIGSVAMAVGIAFTFGAIATAAIGYDRADHA